MLEWVVSSITSVLCVILGFLLDRWLANREKKPKLVFSMCSTPSDMVDAYETRTKYSNTEYSIEIFNVGQQPVIIDSFELLYKNMTVTCTVPDEDRIVAPYKNIQIVLNQQEADSLLYWCKKYDFDKCSVRVYFMGGKTFTSTLEVPLIHIRAEFARNIEDTN